MNGTKVAVGEEFVTVITKFEPLDLKSMSAFSTRKSEDEGVSNATGLMQIVTNYGSSVHLSWV